MTTEAALQTPTPTSTPSPGHPLPPRRVLSIDVYRGLIMLLLVGGAWGVDGLAEATGWNWAAAFARQFEHAPWTGLRLWDLVQPGFLFVVGLAMPFALAARRAAGTTAPWRHAAARSLRLLVLSQVIMSIRTGILHLHLTNVLSQIAFTYFFCFLLMQLRLRLQVVAALLILAGYTLLFFLFPGGEGAFSRTDNVGLVIESATAAHFYNGWENRGLYPTINFIPSIVTTLVGVWAGLLLRSGRAPAARLRILLAGAGFCLLAGFLLDPVIPIVKRIWTASFTLFSLGWVLAGLAAVYWLVDIRQRRGWTFPLVVIGANSIFIYCLHIVLQPGIGRSVEILTAGLWFLGPLAPVGQAFLVILVMWSLCFWLYRRHIFLKV